MGTTAENRSANGRINKVSSADRAAHDWYRFVLSYPPHLVHDYLDRFSITKKSGVVLDPFCGTGTTLVECKKLGVSSIGIEANSMARFASATKVDWSPDPSELIEHAHKISASAIAELEQEGIIDNVALFGFQTGKQKHLRTLPGETHELLLTNSISPLPLHKTLVLLDHLRRSQDKRYHNHELLALARALVQSISNLEFGPEVGVGPRKSDAAVIAPWIDTVRVMAEDLSSLRVNQDVPAIVLQADARDIKSVLEPGTIDAVITSPPYPNEKDYTRTSRLESVLLEFIRDKKELRLLKNSLVRSNTRNVYKGDDDDSWVADHPEIQRIAEEIEARRVKMGKTSGFERLYPKVTKLYFGGMARHLAELREVLRPGAHLAYVVGDQASYLRVMIRTGQLLAGIAKQLGYELLGIDLFRTRLATATREQLREEVVVLRWPS